MTKIIDLSAEEAKEHFLKRSSYFNGDFPDYISFEPILKDVSNVLKKKYLNGENLREEIRKAASHQGVNYSFASNKDGRFAWRPIELMHPVIYVSLVNLLCSEENWRKITNRLKVFDEGVVKCCSLPVASTDHQSDKATQIHSWWQAVEQRSLELSLEFSHVLHTDVTDCYGSLYTHSIAWALHGFEEAKENKGSDELLGNKVDKFIRAGRYGQTNGISQGSVLMDFIAELTLGYVDKLITDKLKKNEDFRILRYRDDYRIFTNSDVRAEEILKVVSDQLWRLGMRLSVSKTSIGTNIIEGSVKADKLVGIDMQDLGTTNAHTLQKQLLRLHRFGRRYPNSGALRRLLSEILKKIDKRKEEKLDFPPDDLEVLAAIATDIALVSPTTFPAVVGILSHVISFAQEEEKSSLWKKVREKMRKAPHNGHSEIWLQRIAIKIPSSNFESEENICKIVEIANGKKEKTVNGEKIALWNNGWIDDEELRATLNVAKIIVGEPDDMNEIIEPEEIALFIESASHY